MRMISYPTILCKSTFISYLIVELNFDRNKESSDSRAEMARRFVVRHDKN